MTDHNQAERDGQPPLRHWTAGELRAALTGVPDDTPVVVTTEDPEHGDMTEEWATCSAGYGRIDWGDGYGLERDQAFGLNCRIAGEFRIKPDRPWKNRRPRPPGRAHVNHPLQARRSS